MLIADHRDVQWNKQSRGEPLKERAPLIAIVKGDIGRTVA